MDGGSGNGSLGLVRASVYSEGKSPPEQPEYILIKFHNYNGPYIWEDLFPIIPVSRTCMDGVNNDIECTRIQFPFTLAKAMTIHKSQGLTLAKVVIDVGLIETTVGSLLVGLTRTRQLSDIMFINMHPKQRFDNIVNIKHHKLRMSFFKDLKCKTKNN